MPAQYERFDTCYGIIEGKSKYGIYLILDNDQEAFAYGYTTIPIGSEICCSVRKPAKEQKNRLIEITTDSSIQSEEMEDFLLIKKELERISGACESLKLWIENKKLLGEFQETNSSIE